MQVPDTGAEVALLEVVRIADPRNPFAAGSLAGEDLAIAGGGVGGAVPRGGRHHPSSRGVGQAA
jgi:hypothetical protein